LNDLTLFESDEIAYHKDTDRFRKMIGRYIHSYDVPNDVLERLLDEPEPYREMVMEYLDEWVEETNIPVEDMNRMFNSEVISELMEKYKKEPLTEEKEKQILKKLDDVTMKFGVIKGENDIDINVVYFGDGSDKSRIHQYHLEGNTLVIHRGEPNEWAYFVDAYSDIANEINNPTPLN